MDKIEGTLLPGNTWAHMEIQEDTERHMETQSTYENKLRCMEMHGDAQLVT